MNTNKKGGSFRTAGETIIAKACRTVPGFAKTYQTFERAQTPGQRSKSAIHNYGRTKVALHFGIDPVHLSIEQINDFLYSMLKTSTSPSKSYFRHTVYGLKCLFKIMGKQEKALKMPPLRDKGKGRKDRYVVLSKLLVKGILPQRFVKIRHYGFLSSRRKSTELPALQGMDEQPTPSEKNQQPEPKHKPTWQEVCRQRFKFDPQTCPCCRKGEMKTIETILPRSPPYKIKKLLKPTLKCAV